MTLDQYYADPAVCARMREYCGGSAGHAPTCEFVAGMCGEGLFPTWADASRHPPEDLEVLLATGADVARALWDHQSLLVHLDLDYQNVDVQGEPYHHPAEVFIKMEPLYRATCHVLRRFGLDLYAVMTGRGYHFTGRVPLESSVVDRLASLAPRPAWLDTLPARRPAWLTAPLPERHARAYVGAGMLAEFLAHAIRARAQHRSPIPVVLNGTVVGGGLVGRESASIDLSYAGDPIDVRHIRVAFGAYQKHRFRPDIVAHRGASEQPPFVAVPRTGDALEQLLSYRRDLRRVARAARSATATLPDVTTGVGRVLNAYDGSSLAAFHRGFYATSPTPVAELPDVFARIMRTSPPACVVDPLCAPNDRLLQPAIIQHVTRALMAQGVAPREIADVVHSRYLADCNWGNRWSWMDAASRAEFDVRVFAGLLATGHDECIDFNCRSAQEKGLCPGRQCPSDLRVDRERLLDRVRP